MIWSPSGHVLEPEDALMLIITCTGVLAAQRASSGIACSLELPTCSSGRCSLREEGAMSMAESFVGHGLKTFPTTRCVVCGRCCRTALRLRCCETMVPEIDIVTWDECRCATPRHLFKASEMIASVLRQFIFTFSCLSRLDGLVEPAEPAQTPGTLESRSPRRWEKRLSSWPGINFKYQIREFNCREDFRSPRAS
jgi:hypothetical protein